MDIGRLHERITFYVPKEIKNNLNQSTTTLQELKTVWASVEPTKGREYQEAQKLRPELTYKIFTRHFEFVNQDTVIKHKDRYFNIISVANVNSENKMLEIYCTEFPKSKYKEYKINEYSD